ncbi:hypothetical protein AB0M58_42940 [Streptomyces bobili]|uniref:hypothetical protein n=1 Tax=Streptomyces bobili TaxID=67280 RepID=UPI003426B8EA
MMRLVTKVTCGLKPRIEWVDADGVVGGQELGRLDWRERQWLFIEGLDGPEPAWLWLAEQGLPMAPDPVERRVHGCEPALQRGPAHRGRASDQPGAGPLGAGRRPCGGPFRLAEVRGKSPYATPHAARHSYA